MTTAAKKRRGRPPKAKSAKSKPTARAKSKSAPEPKPAVEAVGWQGEPQEKPQEKPQELEKPRGQFDFLSDLPHVKKFAEELVCRMGVDGDELLRGVFLRTWRDSKKHFSEGAMARQLRELLDRAKKGLRI